MMLRPPVMRGLLITLLTLTGFVTVFTYVTPMLQTVSGFSSGWVSIALDLPRNTCVPVGGGKDSIVALECLKHSGEPLTLFSLGDAEPIGACIAAAGLPFIRVHRRLDSGLLKLNEATYPKDWTTWIALADRNWNASLRRGKFGDDSTGMRKAVETKNPGITWNKPPVTYILEHGYCHSLYVTDPNGLIVEFTLDDAKAPEWNKKRKSDAHSELKRWLGGDHTPNNIPNNA